jgi:Spy/CpxP family protein refolding chaperone
MKKIVIAASLFLGLAVLSTASAQTPDDDIQLFRKDVRSLKKQIIAANLELTDGEAQQFWPIYDRYTSEMIKITDKKFALLEEYARNYNTMTDEDADAYIQGRAAIEDAIVQLRLKYMPIFRKVLSGRTAALFTQMDWRIGLVMDLQLASQVPMIEP